MKSALFVAPLALSLIGASLFGGALPAVAADFPGPQRPGIVLAAADREFDAKKNEYLAKARAEMKAWRDKIATYEQKARADSHEASDQASADLKAAWANTEAASDRLADATEQGWEKAKSAFEQASQDLSDQWRRVTAGNG